MIDDILNARWKGRPLSTLQHNELFEVILWLAGEVEALRADRDKWARAGDAGAYLSEKALRS